MYIDTTNDSSGRMCLNAGHADTAQNADYATESNYAQSANSATSATTAATCTGNAATATNVAWSGVTGKPSTYPPEDHTHSYLPLSGGTVTGALIVDNGNSSGSVSISEDSEGGTIRLYGKNGTYCYEIDSYNDEEIRIHTAQKHPSDIGYKSIKWSGKTGALTADSFNGNAATATKLATAQTIKLTGDVTGSASFTGDTECSITATVADNSHNHNYAGSASAGGAATTSNNLASVEVSNQARTGITYISGSRALGTSANQIALDSTSGDPNVISAPSAGTYTNGTLGNVQIMRFYCGDTYWTDLFTSPNNKGFWNRNVFNGTGQPWVRMWQAGDSVTGAVWNDYAECRESDCYEAGYVLSENGDDTLSKSNERLAPFAGVSSDTWGFSQGETEKAKTHIAVAGRVLVYPYQDRNNYKPGDCVCAAPGGTVDIMTREEVINWPDRIVGTVSCVPDYETWGGGENADRDPVEVNGRIWIKVR